MNVFGNGAFLNNVCWFCLGPQTVRRVVFPLYCLLCRMCVRLLLGIRTMKTSIEGTNYLEQTNNRDGKEHKNTNESRATSNDTSFLPVNWVDCSVHRCILLRLFLCVRVVLVYMGIIAIQSGVSCFSVVISTVPSILMVLLCSENIPKILDDEQKTKEMTNNVTTTAPTTRAAAATTRIHALTNTMEASHYIFKTMRKCICIRVRSTQNGWRI